MITEARNKVIGTDQVAKKAEAVLEEYHFAGSGEWVPQTVRAASREAAHEEWLRTRQPARAAEAEHLPES